MKCACSLTAPYRTWACATVCLRRQRRGPCVVHWLRSVHVTAASSACSNLCWSVLCVCVYMSLYDVCVKDARMGYYSFLGNRIIKRIICPPSICTVFFDQFSKPHPPAIRRLFLGLKAWGAADARLESSCLFLKGDWSNAAKIFKGDGTKALQGDVTWDRLSLLILKAYFVE